MFLSKPRLIIASTVVVLTTMVWSPAGTAAPVAQVERRTDTSEIRIGTYNIRAGVPMDAFKSAVDEFKEHADVIGLQEIGLNDRNKHLLQDIDWGYYRPPALQQNPLIWRRDKFDFLSARGYRIALARDLHGEHSGDEAKGDSWATIVRLRDRASGEVVSFVNVHLVRGAVKGGRPVANRPHLFRLYADQVVGLMKATREEIGVSDRVYVLGDFNVGYKADAKWRHKKLPLRQFGKIGFRSMWEKSPYLSSSLGTKNDALIDQIFTAERSTAQEIRTEIAASDHLPAVGVYSHPAPPPDYEAGIGTAGFGEVRLVPNGNRDGDTENNGPSKIPSLFVPVIGDPQFGYVRVRIDEGSATLSPDGNEPGDFAVDVSALYDNDFTTNEIAIDIVGDRLREGDETFTLTLVDPVNTVTNPDTSSIEITIRDDD